MKKVLTIAGSDSSGGAGIQADLKTMTVHNTYGMSVITALTAQNTMGVTGIMEVSPEFVGKQIDSIFTDIFPDSVKIGMVASGEIIDVIAEKLEFYKAENIVIDPVMVATSGSRLFEESGIEILINKLFPLAKVITPNIPEAEVISGMKISSKADMIKAAEVIYKKINKAVLIKGGHLLGDATDLLLTGNGEKWFSAERVNNPNTHGTGCTLSSAIACNLAMGYSLEKSIKNAKDYLTGALRAGLDLGKGSGPLMHTYEL